MKTNNDRKKDGFDFQIMQTGVPNLDIVLGGGIPVGSFNLIAGAPGTGKTILSQQIMFHNATLERQALHFTVLGEPVAKLLRYQRRFPLFDPSMINTAVRYVDIGDVIRKEGLDRGMEVIVSRVERYSPAIVIVDSVRAVREIASAGGSTVCVPSPTIWPRWLWSGTPPASCSASTRNRRSAPGPSSPWPTASSGWPW